MECVAFPLLIKKTGQLARSNGAEESLLQVLRIMLTTPAAGWLGSPNFGLRDVLPELPFKSQVRSETVRRINENLRALGIGWAELKVIEIDPTSDIYEPAYLLTLACKDKGEEIQQIKL
jgi:hypothetical protein